MTTPMEEFAQECLRVAPGGTVTKPEARVAWVAWCSDRRLRPGPGTGMSKAIVAAGGKARQKPTRWEGVALSPLRDSGYRAGAPSKGTWTQQASPGPVATRSEVTEALRALQAAGLVTDRDALNDAWRELVA